MLSRSFVVLFAGISFNSPGTMALSGIAQADLLLFAASKVALTAPHKTTPSISHCRLCIPVSTGIRLSTGSGRPKRVRLTLCSPDPCVYHHSRLLTVCQAQNFISVHQRSPFPYKCNIFTRNVFIVNCSGVQVNQYRAQKMDECTRC